MFLRKVSQFSFIFIKKSSIRLQKIASRHFSTNLFPKVICRNNFSKAVLVSAGVSLSVYIALKKVATCETSDLENYEVHSSNDIYGDAICRSRDVLQRLKDEVGIPGIVVGVSINGRSVWTEGLGYANVENRVLCSADTVMRIASISKAITMAAAAKLWEDGKLDLDKPVQEYVPYFPIKTFDGKQVTITCRQLVSHLGGIRHYKKENSSNAKKNKIAPEIAKKNEISDDLTSEEYYATRYYIDVKSALDRFKDDPLVTNPGSKFYYSTYGWTLISAIVEAASKEQFSVHITKLFKTLGMSNTYLDVNDTLIYKRSGNYMKNKNGNLVNAPYVDNSYKWAGGGFLSTVGDLLRFGNAMLYSFQSTPETPTSREDLSCENENLNNNATSNLPCDTNFASNKNVLPGFLKSNTVKTLWTPVSNMKEVKYGMGWCIIPQSYECMFCENRKFCAFHTGGAVGATSILLIVPKTADEKINNLNETSVPTGIVVSILTNLHSVKHLSKIALEIAEIFDNC